MVGYIKHIVSNNNMIVNYNCNSLSNHIIPHNTIICFTGYGATTTNTDNNNNGENDTHNPNAANGIETIDNDNNVNSFNYSYTYNYNSTNYSNDNSKRKTCFVFRIMNPMGTFRNFWNFIVTFLLLYTCLEIPYTLAFNINLTLNHWSGILAFSIDISLLVDIIINFRTAYFDNYDSLVLITDPKKIAKKLAFIHTIFFFFLSFFLF